MMTTTTTSSAVVVVARKAKNSTTTTTPLRRTFRGSTLRKSAIGTTTRDDDCEEDTNNACERQEKNGGGFSRRDAVLSAVVGAASVMLANPEEAKATAPAEFAEETLKMIGMTKDILNGKDYDAAKKQYDPTKLAEFEEYRKYWFEKYQYQHGKSFYGYANTWNAQAKVGFQISMSSREEAKSEYPNGFDPESTAYNKAYLLKILDKAEEETKDFDSRNAF